MWHDSHREVSVTGATVVDERLLKAVSLQRAVSEFLKSSKDVGGYGKGLEVETRRSYRVPLERLAAVEPNLMTHLLNPLHIQAALSSGTRPETDREFALRKARNPRAVRRTGRAPGSMNIDNTAYRQFVDWCKAMQYLSPYSNPMHRVKNVPKSILQSQRDEKRWLLPYGQRAAYLEAAGARHERDRAMGAFGLYGGRRFSDLKDMRIRDIDLDSQTFRFTNKKAGGVRVELPYSLWPEFVSEVHRWLGALVGQFGELDPDWYLFPTRVETLAGFTFDGAPKMYPGWEMDPENPVTKTSNDTDVHKALAAINAPMDRPGLGHHTLRHSCGNWLENVEYWRRDHIKLWLQHQNMSTTAIYLSKGDDIKRLRDHYGNGPVPEERREKVAPRDRRKFHLELLSDVDEDAA